MEYSLLKLMKRVSYAEGQELIDLQREISNLIVDLETDLENLLLIESNCETKIKMREIK